MFVSKRGYCPGIPNTLLDVFPKMLSTRLEPEPCRSLGECSRLGLVRRVTMKNELSHLALFTLTRFQKKILKGCVVSIKSLITDVFISDFDIRISDFLHECRFPAVSGKRLMRKLTLLTPDRCTEFRDNNAHAALLFLLRGGREVVLRYQPANKKQFTLDPTALYAPGLFFLMKQLEQASGTQKMRCK